MNEEIKQVMHEINDYRGQFTEILKTALVKDEGAQAFTALVSVLALTAVGLDMAPEKLLTIVLVSYEMEAKRVDDAEAHKAEVLADQAIQNARG